MDVLENVAQLITSGHFSDALRVLQDRPFSSHHRPVVDVLRADLLERTGRHGASRDLTNSLVRRKDLPANYRSTCEFVLGRLDWNGGDNDSAVVHLQKSVSLAKQSSDLERLCW